MFDMYIFNSPTGKDLQKKISDCTMSTEFAGKYIFFCRERIYLIYSLCFFVKH